MTTKQFVTLKAEDSAMVAFDLKLVAIQLFGGY